MTVFPPGEWSSLLVGDQWPDDQDLMALSRGRTNRGQVKASYVRFADSLRNAQTGALAEQQGHTANDLRDAFRQGEKQARQVAEKNGVKESAYDTAYDGMLSLQHDLTNLAEEGNKQIKGIQDSKESTEAKVTQIVSVIHQYRTLSNLASAKYGGNMLDAMQRILDADGVAQPARQFANAHGLDIGQMYRQPNQQGKVDDQVRRMLGHADSTHVSLSATPSGTPPQETGGGPSAPYHGGHLPTVTQPPTVTQSGNGETPALQPVPVLPQAFPDRGQLPSSPDPAPVAPVQPPASAPAPASGLPGAPAQPVHGSATSIPAPLAPTGLAQGLTPGGLIHSFDKGLHADAAISPPTGAMPATPLAPAEPTAVATTPSANQSASVNAPVNAPVFDTPPPVAHTPVPAAIPAPQVVPGPAAQAPIAATPPSSGPLPAYASDLRSTISAATTPVTPPSPPPMAMPGSAPVHPSAGQGNPAPPTVVHRGTPPVPPSILGAVAATTATGAASANANARARLQRLVFAMARQQPRLAWAAGDRAETTVLATDLAGGWIPPGIELPAGVTLLPPGRRRGGLESLLGEVTVAAGYTPHHHIPEEDEPVPTSPRPRQAAEIDELGWELNQATQWRDGLPRLAHTLAKAASAGTGVVDTEVDQLHEYVAAVSTRVLDNYPDNVNPHDVGNWQLLAAIDALVAGDKIAANYHFAWFRA